MRSNTNRNAFGHRVIVTISCEILKMPKVKLQKDPYAEIQHAMFFTTSVKASLHIKNENRRLLYFLV